jgi:hypothetical protein
MVAWRCSKGERGKEEKTYAVVANMVLEFLEIRLEK